MTIDEQVELLGRYLSEERAHVLARDFGIHRSSVSELLLRTGTRRPRSMTEDEINEAAALYDQGLSLAYVRNRLSRDPKTVRLGLIAAGTKMRDTHGRDRSTEIRP